MTDNYTLMCDKHPEIQRLWEKSHGDRIYNTAFKQKMLFGYSYKTETSEYQSEELFFSSKGAGPWNIKYAIWLPRIEDLVGMVGTIKHSGQKYTGVHLYGHMWNWIKHLHPYNHIELQMFSMPELWLAFVSHELWQLKWDGKGWVKV